MIPGFMESCPGLCPCLCTATLGTSKAESGSTLLAHLFSYQLGVYHISFKSPDQGEYNGAINGGQYSALCPLQPLQMCCLPSSDMGMAADKDAICFLLLLLLASMWYQ